eukprot:gene48538-65104_t
MSVTSFICAGEMINAMYLAGGYRSVHEMIDAARSPRGILPKAMECIKEALGGVKVISKHLGHTMKCRGFGPPADVFHFTFNNSEVSEQEYFEDMARTNP